MAKKPAKFKSLIHNGVVFPQPFEGFPEDIKSKSDFLKTLTPLGQEMFFHYATKRDTDYVKDSVFNKNFWDDLKKQVGGNYKSSKFPESFKKEIDIIFDWNTIRKEKKKEYNKAHKEEIQKQKDAIKAKYSVAIIDGKEQPLGIYAIEAGGIFMGRGKCPIRGCWKYQAEPEDIEINFVGPADQVPQAPAGHHWKKVTNNTNSCIIGAYEINVGNKTKKHKDLLFAATSDLKTACDQKKFEKATKLVKNWKTVEDYIQKGLQSKDQMTRECAAIAWLMQNTAIRIGNERDEFESQEVVGASTLKIENMRIDGTTMELTFVGKDSVPFHNVYDIPVEVANVLTGIIGNRSGKEEIFKAGSGDVNAFLKGCFDFMTPKLFRTAWGTKLLMEELQKHPCNSKMTDAQKKAVYNNAALEVSKKLNHQRNVSKNYKEQIEKADTRIEEAKQKNKELKEKIKEQIKKLQKDVEIAKKCYSGDKLKEKLEKIKEKKEKLAARLEKSDNRIEKLELDKDFKKNTKNIAIGTAKSAYSSPLAAFSWCKDNNIDIGFIYSKGLQKKYTWAETAPADYWKKFPNV